MSANADTASIQSSAFAFLEQLAGELSRGDLALPSFPDSVVRIRKALDDPNVTPDRLARIAMADQVLAGRLLKMANSALLQRGGVVVTELRTAIMRLGFRMVRNSAVSVATQQMFHTKDLGAALSRIIREAWEESTKVAAASYVIAKSLTKHNPDEAFLAGILHNVGKVYIYTRARSQSAVAADPELLGQVQDAWQGPIGKAIDESWGFSPAQAAAAEGYRDLARTVDSDVADLTDVVQVARIVAAHDPQEHEAPDFSAVPAGRRLKLDGKNAAPLLAASSAEIRALAETLRG
jgi:HD-like signal output (HDOD) protein